MNREEEFYNLAKAGTIREAVAEFMDNQPQLSRLTGEKYYQVEDDICQFIHDNQYKIYSMLSHTFNKQDVRNYIDDNGLTMPDEDVLEAKADQLEEMLADSDDIAETRNIILNSIMEEI